MPANLNDHAEKNSFKERAGEVRAYLGKKFPTYLCQVHASISCGFWLGLPRKFRRLHSPNHDAIVILVDETGKEYLSSISRGKDWIKWEDGEGFQSNADYLSKMLWFSSWSNLTNLRANWSSETDGALGLVHLSHAKQTDFGKIVSEASPLAIHQ